MTLKNVGRLLFAVGIVAGCGLGAGAQYFNAGQSNLPAQDKDLLVSAAKGDLASVKRLLANGAHIEAVDGIGATPLMLASGAGKMPPSDYFLARWMRVNGHQGRYAALMTDGNVATVKLLLARGAGVNAKTVDGDGALACAAVRDNAEVVRLLLSHHANPNLSNNSGFTPLMHAAGTGNLNALRVLTSTNADVNAVSKRGESALILAAEWGYKDVITHLLSKGAKLEAVDGRGQTVLMHAAHNGSINGVATSAVSLFLSKGVSIDAVDKDGRTALLHAVDVGSVDSMRLLLDAGAKIDGHDGQGMTPLIHAALSCGAPQIELLLQRGADPGLKDNQGRTALDYARIPYYPWKVQIPYPGADQKRAIAVLEGGVGVGEAGWEVFQRRGRRVPAEVCGGVNRFDPSAKSPR